jgi:hypothetical protein
MKHVLEDSINPNRREALRPAFADLERCGEKPFEHNIRTARPGEEITGQILGHDDRVASMSRMSGSLPSIAPTCPNACLTTIQRSLSPPALTFPAWDARDMPRHTCGHNRPSSHSGTEAPG